MMKSWIRLIVVIGLLLSVVPLVAQEDEEELPEIPYYRASSGFNIPILQLEGWTDQSTGDTALFVNESLQATLQVNGLDAMDDSAAIQRVISELVSGDIPEPIYNERKGLPNGTWTQQIFVSGDMSISAFSMTRRNFTYIVTFMESSPEYDARILAVRPPLAPAGEGETPTGDFAAGMQEGIPLLQMVADAATYTESAPDLSGNWVTYTYESDPPILMTGLMFNDMVYITGVSGDVSGGLALADAFEIVFLGFFITPANTNYLYMGLAAVAVIFAVLIGSMVWRYFNAQKDLRLVEQLASQD